ncbi:hypothetical protein A5N83_03200 [Rhodococcus sp. 1139]|jgi:hypothetical protein|nr:hypothetical protein A5N83_03200 [Rhodococcus sp. 1139]
MCALARFVKVRYHQRKSTRSADRRSADTPHGGDSVETLALLTEGAGPFGTFGCHDGWAGTVSALAPDGFEAGVSAFDDHVVPTFGRERP